MAIIGNNDLWPRGVALHTADGAQHTHTHTHTHTHFVFFLPGGTNTERSDRLSQASVGGVKVSLKTEDKEKNQLLRSLCLCIWIFFYFVYLRIKLCIRSKCTQLHSIIKLYKQVLCSLLHCICLTDFVKLYSNKSLQVSDVKYLNIISTHKSKYSIPSVK